MRRVRLTDRDDGTCYLESLNIPATSPTGKGIVLILVNEDDAGGKRYLIVHAQQHQQEIAESKGIIKIPASGTTTD